MLRAVIKFADPGAQDIELNTDDIYECGSYTVFTEDFGRGVEELRIPTMAIESIDTLRFDA